MRLASVDIGEFARRLTDWRIISRQATTRSILSGLAVARLWRCRLPTRFRKKFSHLSIRYLGLWDVVGQFGLPGRHLNAGHDLRLPRNVELCFHAMALDETRLLFPLTRLTGSRSHTKTSPVEVWFRGVHSDVGGGNGNLGLNWISLNWMFETAKGAGLPIDAGGVTKNLASKASPQKISVHRADIGPKREFLSDDLLHDSVQLDALPLDREHNNPSVRLGRIDDNGIVTPPTPV